MGCLTMKLIDRKGLAEKFGFEYSDTHLVRMIKAGRFPKPMKFGRNSKNYWAEAEIDALVGAKLAQRDEECVS